MTIAVPNELHTKMHPLYERWRRGKMFTRNWVSYSEFVYKFAYGHGIDLTTKQEII